MECELCIDLANTEGGRCHTCMEKRITELRQKLLQEGQALHEKNMRVLELEQEVADLKEQDRHSKALFQQMEQEVERLREALERINEECEVGVCKATCQAIL